MRNIKRAVTLILLISCTHPETLQTASFERLKGGKRLSREIASAFTKADYCPYISDRDSLISDSDFIEEESCKTIFIEMGNKLGSTEASERQSLKLTSAIRCFKSREIISNPTMRDELCKIEFICQSYCPFEVKLLSSEKISISGSSFAQSTNCITTGMEELVNQKPPSIIQKNWRCSNATHAAWNSFSEVRLGSDGESAETQAQRIGGGSSGSNPVGAPNFDLPKSAKKTTR